MGFLGFSRGAPRYFHAGDASFHLRGFGSDFMTVLSDTTLQAHIQRGELIIGGQVERAKHCAYEFKAGRVVYGGVGEDQRARVIDLAEPGSTSALVKPTAIVWVQSRERVQIPQDMVGIWIQTNSLSRQGLLLLNSTLVEPGYEGHLSAHLANLGTQPAVLAPESTIAKLVLLKLDASAAHLVDGSAYRNYDAFIEGLALKSNSSFLNISEFAADLKEKIEALLTSAQEKAAVAFRTLSESSSKQINQAADASTDEAIKKIAAFEQTTFLRLGGGFLLGFFLAIVFILWIQPYIRTVDIESRERIQQIVKEENEDLRKQLESTIQNELRKPVNEAADPVANPASPSNRSR